MDSGLSDILKHAFGGKKIPQNVRAFRMLTEELLHKHMGDVNYLFKYRTGICKLQTLHGHQMTSAASPQTN